MIVSLDPDGETAAEMWRWLPNPLFININRKAAANLFQTDRQDSLFHSDGMETAFKVWQQRLLNSPKGSKAVGP